MADPKANICKVFYYVFPEITEIANQSQNNRKHAYGNWDIVGPYIFFKAYAQLQILSEIFSRSLCKGFAKSSARKTFFLKRS